MRFVMIVLGLIYTVIGILYLKTDFLWGALVVLIGAVYLFGLERYGEDEERHILAHMIVGGIIGGSSGSFLFLELIVKSLGNGFQFASLDLSFLTISAVSSYLAFRLSRKFS